MNGSVVMTTINPPNNFLETFLDGNKSVTGAFVAGDVMSPDATWSAFSRKDVTFIPFSEQGGLSEELHNLLPPNHYSRKLFAYLAAVRSGADFVIDTDDDNLSLMPFPKRSELGGEMRLVTEEGWVNVHRLFGDPVGWPRGLPLDEISKPPPKTEFTTGNQIGVIQGLVQGDPDLDAISRLVLANTPVVYGAALVQLGEGSVSPFNSQNTLFFAETFPLLYLPSTVTFRFTDILRSVVAQPILWKMGLGLGFFGPNGRQDRNPHNIFADFLDEIPMYLNCKRAFEIVSNVVSNQSLVDNLCDSYAALAVSGIVLETELDALHAWLESISR